MTDTLLAPTKRDRGRSRDFKKNSSFYLIQRRFYPDLFNYPLTVSTESLFTILYRFFSNKSRFIISPVIFNRFSRLVAAVKSSITANIIIIIILSPILYFSPVLDVPAF